MGVANALPLAAEVAVIGAGAMGAGIAQIAAMAGHRVCLFDTGMGAADRAKAKIGETLDMLASKGKIDADQAKAAASRIVAVHALGDLVSAKLVVEAVVEDLAVKRNLFRELEVVVTPDTILATNTSSFSITALAAGMQHPGRVVGMHFFNPAPLMPLVEVVSGLATDCETAGVVHATALAWGKLPVHARSTPGFIVNRCARPFYAEALRVLGEQGADPATLDALMRDAGGFRMGPFELMDLIGLDINLAVTRSVWEAFFYDSRFTPSVAQHELVTAGYFGRKSGRGFFDYGPDALKTAPASESPQSPPGKVARVGELRMGAELVARLANSGLAPDVAIADPRFPQGALRIDNKAWLVPGDGRTATAIAANGGVRDVVIYDLAFDFAKCSRVGVARADTCSDAAFAAAVGALQACGIAVSRIDDVAGMIVLRTVAMLSNEAADAVAQGVASAADVDLAMQKGVNYPSGPLAWGDVLGVVYVRDTLANLAAHYGEDRYRLSPLIARRCASGDKLRT
ncbi:MAG: 3-hydroxyacyl-CoA dehydrogenase [Betaproteobacteria bacterium]